MISDMDTLEALKRRLDRFFPKSRVDARNAVIEATDRPLHWVGEAWSPTREQVDAAIATEAAQRSGSGDAAFQWTLLQAAPELDAVRTAIVCGTDAVKQNRVSGPKSTRLIRALLFDEACRLYVRRLRFSKARVLVELRHPEIFRAQSRLPVGLRFLCLSRDNWQLADQVGIWLDGTHVTPAVFQDAFTATPLFDLEPAADDDLVIVEYLRFCLDHLEGQEGERFETIAHPDDVVADGVAAQVPTGAPVEQALVAQARIPTASPADSQASTLSALGIDRACLIPPIVVRRVAAGGERPPHAVVFTTVLSQQGLYHWCWRVFADGAIESTDIIVRRTPDGETLPIQSLRAFADQKVALDELAKRWP